MWKDYELPTSANIDGKEFKIRSDYRVILDIMSAFNDPNLSDREKVLAGLEIFYVDYEKIENVEEAVNLMMLFISGNQTEEASNNKPKLMDWEQDISLIIPPVNKVLGQEIRAMEYLHWWTFLGAYMEIGECTFNTFVGIRDKKIKGKKLDKWEEEIYRNNYKKIDLKKRYDDNLQAEIDEILGRRV